jgi:hypothetical protein
MNDPNDPNQSPDLDPNMSLTGKKGGKGPLIVVALLVVGGGGFLAFKMMTKQADRKKHAALMDDFQKVEREELGKFWLCVLGPNVDPAMFPDNLALSARITSQFGVDPKNYPTKVREECTAKAKDARGKVTNLQALPEYEASLKKYADAIKGMEGAFDDWTKAAPAQIKDMEISKKLTPAGSAWHGFEGGKPTDDLAAYDNFIHCAVPTLDTLKDGQAVVEFLFKECKDAKYLEKLDHCSEQLVAPPPLTPTKNWQAAVKKFGPDDREMSAFEDCLRKGRKGRRRDDLADVGKAWVAWLEAGREVRKIGKEALKD